MRVASFQLVTGFRLDPTIVLTCGKALQKLQKTVGGNLLSINVPDGAPPFLPRAALRLQDSILGVALERFEVSAVPPAHVAEDVGAAVQFAVQRGMSVLSLLAADMPPYEWSGIIMVLQYPELPLVSTDARRAAEPFFDRLLTIGRKERELSSFQARFGFREGDFFVTYGVTAYETRHIEIPVKSNQQVIIDAKEFPLKECGLQVVVDINTKPIGVLRGPLEDQQALLAEAAKKSHHLAQELNLEGMLK